MENIDTNAIFKVLHGARKVSTFSERLARHGFYKDTTIAAATRLRKKTAYESGKKTKNVQRINEEFDSELKFVLQLQAEIAIMQQELAASIEVRYAALRIQTWMRCRIAMKQLRILRISRFVVDRWKFIIYFHKRQRACQRVIRSIRHLIFTKAYRWICTRIRATKLIQRKYRARIFIRRARILLQIMKRTSEVCAHVSLFAFRRALRVCCQRDEELSRTMKAAKKIFIFYLHRRRLRLLRSYRAKTVFYVLSTQYADVQESCGRYNSTVEYIRNSITSRAIQKAADAFSRASFASRRGSNNPMGSTPTNSPRAVLAPNNRFTRRVSLMGRKSPAPSSTTDEDSQSSNSQHSSRSMLSSFSPERKFSAKNHVFFSDEDIIHADMPSGFITSHLPFADIVQIVMDMTSVATVTPSLLDGQVPPSLLAAKVTLNMTGTSTPRHVRGPRPGFGQIVTSAAAGRMSPRRIPAGGAPGGGGHESHATPDAIHISIPEQQQQQHVPAHLAPRKTHSPKYGDRVSSANRSSRSRHTGMAGQSSSTQAHASVPAPPILTAPAHGHALARPPAEQRKSIIAQPARRPSVSGRRSVRVAGAVPAAKPTPPALLLHSNVSKGSGRFKNSAASPQPVKPNPMYTWKPLLNEPVPVPIGDFPRSSHPSPSKSSHSQPTDPRKSLNLGNRRSLRRPDSVPNSGQEQLKDAELSVARPMTTPLAGSSTHSDGQSLLHTAAPPSSSIEVSPPEPRRMGRLSFNMTIDCREINEDEEPQTFHFGVHTEQRVHSQKDLSGSGSDSDSADEAEDAKGSVHLIDKVDTLRIKDLLEQNGVDSFDSSDPHPVLLRPSAINSQRENDDSDDEESDDQDQYTGAKAAVPVEPSGRPRAPSVRSQIGLFRESSYH